MISEIISTVKQLNFLLLLTTFQLQRSIEGQFYFYIISLIILSLFFSWMTILTSVPINLKLLKEAIVTFNLLLVESNLLVIYCPHFVEFIAPLMKNPHFTDETIGSQRRTI